MGWSSARRTTPPRETQATPSEGLGRIAIATSASSPKRMYAMISVPTTKAGGYRSDDGQTTFDDWMLPAIEEYA